MSGSAGTRYATITSTDQSANIWVVSVISICVSTACFVTRGLSKSRTELKFGPDDYTLIAGWVRVFKCQCFTSVLTMPVFERNTGRFTDDISHAGAGQGYLHSARRAYQTNGASEFMQIVSIF